MYKPRRYVQRVGCKASIAFDLLKTMCKYVNNCNELTFVDLFGGGGSMTAQATYFFRNVIYNEINKEVFDLFHIVQDDDIINKLKPVWVSRAEFNAIKQKKQKTPEENLILTIWSFGNNREAYIYGKDIERRKFVMHKIIFSENEEEYKRYIKIYNEERLGHFEKYGAIWDVFLPDDDWLLFKNAVNRRYYKFGASAKFIRKFYKSFDIDLLIKERGNMKNKKDILLIEEIKKIQSQGLERLERLERLQGLERLERLERLQGLERLERLENLQRLERLERLEGLVGLQKLEGLENLQRLDIFNNIKTYNLDYREVPLPSPSSCVIYCDPPYRNTMEYENKFNFNDFDNYLLSLKNKGYTIFVSEYNLPLGNVVGQKTKRGFISQITDKYTGFEKLYLI